MYCKSCFKQKINDDNDFNNFLDKWRNYIIYKKILYLF